MKRGEEIIFRDATEEDIDEIISLEKEIWGEEGADERKIRSRMEVFPQGNLVAECNRAVVSYLAFQYVNDKRRSGNFTWTQVTDDGTICNSHIKNGNYAYGINLTVGRKAQCLNLGEALLYYGIGGLIRDNIKGSFLGSRMPGFKSYLRKHPKIGADEYIRLKWKGKARDPEIRLYESLGFQVLRVLPNYFPDPESMNFGVLLFLPNDLYMSEERGAIAQRMRTEAKNLIRTRG
jgi:ribosomal protein S18 acetylase RimI-like enzyme